MSAMVGRLCINEQKLLMRIAVRLKQNRFEIISHCYEKLSHFWTFLMKKYLGLNSTMLAPCARPLEFIIEKKFRIVQQLQNQVSHHRELKNFFSNNLQQMITWRRNFF